MTRTWACPQRVQLLYLPEADGMIRTLRGRSAGRTLCLSSSRQPRPSHWGEVQARTICPTNPLKACWRGNCAVSASSARNTQSKKTVHKINSLYIFSLLWSTGAQGLDIVHHLFGWLLGPLLCFGCPTASLIGTVLLLSGGVLS